MEILGSFSKYIFYPIWDYRNGSFRVKALKELEKTQWLSEAKLKERQWYKLKSILKYSYENCEYYRKAFDTLGIRPEDIRNSDDFQEIPLLTKNHVQEHPDSLISRQYRKENLVLSKTGGSTGKSLTVYADKKCQCIRNAAAVRSDRWAKWDIGRKRAAIWGNPPKNLSFRSRLRSALLDRVIYLDTMNLSEKSVSEFIEHYRKHNPQVIFGHSHSIFLFAKFVKAKELDDIKPSGIIATSMMLLPHERIFIEDVFKCPVTNRYGCEEVGLIACECEKHEGMHMNIDHLYMEFLKENGSRAYPGDNAFIVITDLINRGMPLIRYKIEDKGIFTNKKCSCGRGLPLMEKITGRTADFLVKKDGSLVAGVSLIERTLTALTGIGQMQIVQDNINLIKINIVSNHDYNKDCETRLKDEFFSVFGNDIDIKIKQVSEIPQEKTGKYRFSICKVGNQTGDKK